MGSDERGKQPEESRELKRHFQQVQGDASRRRKIWALKMRKVYVRKYIPASFDDLSLGEKKSDK
jgi:hypothetical protein